MLIKFTGKFKDLKSMGFTFHKLFARNYKVYEKKKVWIWVHRGGYVEIQDFYGLSGYILKAIWNGTFPVYERDIKYEGKLSWMSIKKGYRRPCMIHRKTGEIVELREFYKKHADEDHVYDYDSWKELSLFGETFDFLKELKELNIMEIVENEL